MTPDAERQRLDGLHLAKLKEWLFLLESEQARRFTTSIDEAEFTAALKWAVSALLAAPPDPAPGLREALTALVPAGICDDANPQDYKGRGCFKCGYNITAHRLKALLDSASTRAARPAEAPTPEIQRCDGRYPVPHKRDESFLVTYRCELVHGHDGPHGRSIETRPTQEEIEVVHRSFMERPAGRSRLVAHVPDADCGRVGAHRESECGRALRSAAPLPPQTPRTETP